MYGCLLSSDAWGRSEGSLQKKSEMDNIAVCDNEPMEALSPEVLGEGGDRDVVWHWGWDFTFANLSRRLCALKR